jgi:predicted kinase
LVLVGLPASGKSTWARENGITAISSDALRELLADDATDQTIHREVFRHVRALLRTRIAIGRACTAVDATNLTPRERRPYIEIARKLGARVEAVVFDTPLEECLKRNRARARVVPEAAMQTMAAKLRRPSTGEGFARIRVIAAP